MKRILKLLLSLVVYTADLFHAAVRLAVGRPLRGSCSVLYYHEVVETDRARFAAQLDVICRAAHPISPLHPRRFPKAGNHVAITVDDAFISFFRNGLPELERLSIPVLVFVPTDWIGRTVDWKMEEVMASPNERVSSLAELKEFARHPLVSIGSHTATHRKLALLNDAESQAEMSDSKAFLESELGISVQTISFPYGGCTDRDVKLASQLGYKTFFTTLPETLTQRMEDGLVGRFRVDPSDWMIEVKLKAVGAYRWQSRVQRIRSGLRRERSSATKPMSSVCSC